VELHFDIFDLPRPTFRTSWRHADRLQLTSTLLDEVGPAGCYVCTSFCPCRVSVTYLRAHFDLTRPTSAYDTYVSTYFNSRPLASINFASFRSTSVSAAYFGLPRATSANIVRHIFRAASTTFALRRPTATYSNQLLDLP
jgi:hypothetical protein